MRGVYTSINIERRVYTEIAHVWRMKVKTM